MTKKLKLKRKFKFILIGLVLFIIILVVGINKYNTHKYEQTYEFKFLDIGYSKEEIKILLNYFENKELDILVKEEKDELIFELMDSKYYIHNNYDEYRSYIEENKTNTNETITIVNTNNDVRYYEEIFKSNINDNALILVNKYHALESDYVPENLVTISQDHSWGTLGSQKATEETYGAFKSMAFDAESQDITLIINSSYRSYAEQFSVHEEYKLDRGEEYADNIAARAGHSEHQTGLALDIFSTETSSRAEFVNSKAYAYLKDNAHNFGFILRYPEGKEDITGFSFESWHYRYVGTDVATYIYENNITYDEYYAFYIENQ